MGRTVEFLDEVVQEMPAGIRAAFRRIAELIATQRLERIHEPYVEHLKRPVWEMRTKSRNGIARAAYVTATGRHVVVVHVFPKKTQKTPRREIAAALRRD